MDGFCYILVNLFIHCEHYVCYNFVLVELICRLQYVS